MITGCGQWMLTIMGAKKDGCHGFCELNTLNLVCRLRNSLNKHESPFLTKRKCFLLHFLNDSGRLPLTLSLSPMGRGEGEGGAQLLNVLLRHDNSFDLSKSKRNLLK